MQPVIFELFEKTANGEISDAEAQDLARFFDMIGVEKLAATGGGDSPLVKALQEGLGASLALGTAGLAMAGVVEGSKKLFDMATFRRDLNRILETYPEIRSTYPPAWIDLAYQSIRTMNPTVARDPMTGGTLLKQILAQRNTQNPGGTPSFDWNHATSLIQHRPKGQNAAEEVLYGAAREGVLHGLRSYGDAQRQVSETDRMQSMQSFQSKMEADRASREEAREKTRMGREDADRAARAVEGRAGRLLQARLARLQREHQEDQRQKSEAHSRGLEGFKAVAAKSGPLDAPIVIHLNDEYGNPAFDKDNNPITATLPRASLSAVLQSHPQYRP